MELCDSLGLPVEQFNITYEDWQDADELFATTTDGGIVPIIRINQRVFSNDAAGEVSLALQNHYWKWHLDSSIVNQSSAKEVACFETGTVDSVFDQFRKLISEAFFNWLVAFPLNDKLPRVKWKASLIQAE